MRSLIIILFLLVGLNAQESVKKVVFDFTSGDINVFEKKILSGIAYQKAYYEGNLEELEVAVIVHGDGYKFFLKDVASSIYKDDAALIEKHAEFTKRVKSLSEIYEVSFILCAAGLKSLKIEESSLYPFVTFTATSTVGLIDKQSDGYQYVPISK